MYSEFYMHFRHLFSCYALFLSDLVAWIHERLWIKWIYTRVWKTLTCSNLNECAAFRGTSWFVSVVIVLRVKQLDFIFVLLLHVIALCGLCGIFIILIMMTAHKEMSSPKNLQSPTNKLWTAIQNLDMAKTSGVRKL